MTNIRILLCDDEKVIRTGLRKMLTQAYGGCVEIAEAADGQAGCAMYESGGLIWSLPISGCPAWMGWSWRAVLQCSRSKAA